MAPDKFKPGERVVELAGAAYISAAVAGVAAGASAAALAHRPWPVCLAAMAGGYLLGAVMGRFVGRVLYVDARGGRVAITRLGSRGFPTTLQATLVAALPSAVATAGLVSWLLAAPVQPALFAGACCALLAGVMIACVASFV